MATIGLWSLKASWIALPGDSGLRAERDHVVGLLGRVEHLGEAGRERAVCRRDEVPVDVRGRAYVLVAEPLLDG